MTAYPGSIAYDYQDHEQGPWCAECGKRCNPRSDWLDCRHYQCEDCSGAAWPRECLTCLKVDVAEQGNVFRKAWGCIQASWHAGACPFPTCHKHGPHEHLISGSTIVVTPQDSPFSTP